MMASVFIYAQISPLYSYKKDKDGNKMNYSKAEALEILEKNPEIAKNWSAVLQDYGWRDGWANEIDPEFFSDPEYLVYALSVSKQMKADLKKGDFSTFGKNSNGEFSSIEREMYPNELFFVLDPNDLETEDFRFSKDYPAIIYASCICMNGVLIYPKEVFENKKQPVQTKVWTDKKESEEYNPSFADNSPKSGNTYVTNNYYQQNERPYYHEERPRVNFSVGVLFGARDGCWGHSHGFCSHGYVKNYFGYQPSYGPPQISNQTIYVNVINNNTNINTTSPAPPTTGGPVLPVNGQADVYTGGGPVLSVNRFGLYSSQIRTYNQTPSTFTTYRRRR